MNPWTEDKRSIHLDLSSVRFLKESEVRELEKIDSKNILQGNGLILGKWNAG